MNTIKPTAEQEAAATLLVYDAMARVRTHVEIINAIAALIAERDAARAERDAAVALLKEVSADSEFDDMCNAFRRIEEFLQRAAAPPSPAPAKEPA